MPATERLRGTVRGAEMVHSIVRSCQTEQYCIARGGCTCDYGSRVSGIYCA